MRKSIGVFGSIDPGDYIEVYLRDNGEVEIQVVCADGSCLETRYTQTEANRLAVCLLSGKTFQEACNAQ